MLRVGSRAQVMHGNAKMTGGGLRKKDLTYNKAGKIVSRRASNTAKKTMRLQKAGYITTKGQFGAYKQKGGGFVLHVKLLNFAMKKKNPLKQNNWINSKQFSDELLNDELYFDINTTDTDASRLYCKISDGSKTTIYYLHGELSFDTNCSGKSKNRLNIHMKIKSDDSTIHITNNEHNEHNENTTSLISSNIPRDTVIPFQLKLSDNNTIITEDSITYNITYNIVLYWISHYINSFYKIQQCQYKGAIFFNQYGPPLRGSKKRHSGIIKDLYNNNEEYIVIFEVYESTGMEQKIIRKVIAYPFEKYYNLNIGSFNRDKNNQILFVLNFSPKSDSIKFRIRYLIIVYSYLFSEGINKTYKIDVCPYINPCTSLCGRPNNNASRKTKFDLYIKFKDKNKFRTHIETINTQAHIDNMDVYASGLQFKYEYINFNNDDYTSYCSLFVADVLTCAFYTYKQLYDDFNIRDYLPISISYNCPPYKLYDLLSSNKLNNHNNWEQSEYNFKYVST